METEAKSKDFNGTDNNLNKKFDSYDRKIEKIDKKVAKCANQIKETEVNLAEAISKLTSEIISVKQENLQKYEEINEIGFQRFNEIKNSINYEIKHELEKHQTEMIDIVKSLNSVKADNLQTTKIVYIISGLLIGTFMSAAMLFKFGLN